MKSFTESLDKKISYCHQQCRGWQDVAHDYDKGLRWYKVAQWFESKRNDRIKAIFGSC